MQLREEQKSVMQDVKRMLGEQQSGLKSVLLRLPCGFGKTYIACCIVEYLNKTTLLIAPNESIRRQFEETLRKMGMMGRVRPFLPYSDHQPPPQKSHVYLCTKYQVQGTQNRNFELLRPHLQQFDVVVYDEVHEFRDAETFKKLLMFRTDTMSGPIKIGLSWTWFQREMSDDDFQWRGCVDRGIDTSRHVKAPDFEVVTCHPWDGDVPREPVILYACRSVTSNNNKSCVQDIVNAHRCECIGYCDDSEQKRKALENELKKLEAWLALVHYWPYDEHAPRSWWVNLMKDARVHTWLCWYYDQFPMRFAASGAVQRPFTPQVSMYWTHSSCEASSRITTMVCVGPLPKEETTCVGDVLLCTRPQAHETCAAAVQVRTVESRPSEDGLYVFCTVLWMLDDVIRTADATLVEEQEDRHMCVRHVIRLRSTSIRPVAAHQQRKLPLPSENSADPRIVWPVSAKNAGDSDMCCVGSWRRPRDTWCTVGHVVQQQLFPLDMRHKASSVIFPGEQVRLAAATAASPVMAELAPHERKRTNPWPGRYFPKRMRVEQTSDHAGNPQQLPQSPRLPFGRQGIVQRLGFPAPYVEVMGGVHPGAVSRKEDAHPASKDVSDFADRYWWWAGMLLSDQDMLVLMHVVADRMQQLIQFTPFDQNTREFELRLQHLRDLGFLSTSENYVNPQRFYAHAVAQASRLWQEGKSWLQPDGLRTRVCDMATTWTAPQIPADFFRRRSAVFRRTILPTPQGAPPLSAPEVPERSQVWLPVPPILVCTVHTLSTGLDPPRLRTVYMCGDLDNREVDNVQAAGRVMRVPAGEPGKRGRVRIIVDDPRKKLEPKWTQMQQRFK